LEPDHAHDLPADLAAGARSGRQFDIRSRQRQSFIVPVAEGNVSRDHLGRRSGNCPADRHQRQGRIEYLGCRPHCRGAPDGPWVYGALVNNVWSFAGTARPGGVGNAYNSFLLQPFVNYNFGEGWYVNSAPILTSNWLAPASQQWIVPIGAGAGRVIELFDKLPVNLYLGAYYNAVHPSQTGPSWQLRSQLTFIF